MKSICIDTPDGGYCNPEDSLECRYSSFGYCLKFGFVLPLIKEGGRYLKDSLCVKYSEKFNR